MYHIYIIECEHGELYTGITTDISRRMKEHFFQTEKCARFTKSHKAISLKALWITDTRSSASKLEWRIKKLAKSEKNQLIESNENFSYFFKDLLSDNYSRLSDFNINDMLNKK